MGDIILIDRVEAVKKFEEMFKHSNERKMLRIFGAEKMGKSRVMREFRKIASQNGNVACALVDLRSKYQGYRDVMFQIVQQLTEFEFEYFSTVQQEVTAKPKLEIKGLNMLLSRASINLSNQNNDTNDQYYRHKATLAFCNDLKCSNVEKSVLLMFDTFDGASINIQEWINEQFIPSILKIPNVFIVVAGRTLPEIPSSLEDVCESCILESVSLKDHKTFCVTLGIDISDETLTDFHEVFDGTPGLFAEYVTKLKRTI